MNDHSDQTSILPEAQADLSSPRPVWVPVIGTLSTVLGGLRLYQSLLNLATLAAFYRPSVNSYGPMGSTHIVSMLANTLPAGILLVAGIALLRRNRLAVLHLAYAVLGLIWFAYLMWPWLSGVNRSDGWLSGFALLAALPEAAYPAFLLHWFSRAGVRAQIRTWGSPPRPNLANEPPGQ